MYAFTFSFGVHLFANENTEESVCDFMGAHLDEIMRIVNRAFDFHMVSHHPRSWYASGLECRGRSHSKVVL